MSQDPHVLDMLGDDLKAAVLEARTRLADDSIMAEIFAGLVLIYRGDPVAVIAQGLGHDEACAQLAALA
jgi:hypothetical protein